MRYSVYSFFRYSKNEAPVQQFLDEKPWDVIVRSNQPEYDLGLDDFEIKGVAVCML